MNKARMVMLAGLVLACFQLTGCETTRSPMPVDTTNKPTDHATPPTTSGETATTGSAAKEGETK